MFLLDQNVLGFLTVIIVANFFAEFSYCYNILVLLCISFIKFFFKIIALAFSCLLFIVWLLLLSLR